MGGGFVFTFWFLPFWYRLTRVVPEKGPLNGCVCVCVCRKKKIYKNYTTTGYKYSKNTILQITSVKENEKANGTELI